MIISYQLCRYDTGIEEQKLSFTKFLFSKQEIVFSLGTETIDWDWNLT